jgi:hypothetical protein
MPGVTVKAGLGAVRPDPVLVPLRDLMIQQWATRVHNPMSLAEMSSQTILRPPCRPGKVASDLLSNGREGRI